MPRKKTSAPDPADHDAGQATAVAEPDADTPDSTLSAPDLAGHAALRTAEVIAAATTSGGGGGGGHVEALPEIKWIALDDIALDVPNHRHAALADDAATRRLAASIEAEGLRQPILVCERPGADGKQTAPYALVYGHRRVAAVQILKWPRILAEVRPPMGTDEVLVVRAIENLHRQDLNVMEQVIAVEQLDGRGQTIDEISGQIGQDKQWVSDRLYLRRIVPAVRELALRDLLLIGHLRELAKVGDEVQQIKAALWALDDRIWLSTLKELTAEVNLIIKKSVNADGTPKGNLKRRSVDDLRNRVQELQRDLGRVPWQLAMPFAGKPLCLGCESNTATDETLFGKTDGGVGFVGRCMNAACFEAKSKAAEQAKVKAAAAMVKKKDASMAAAIEATPVWLRREPVQRLAQKSLKPASAPGSGKGGAGGGAGGKKGKADPHKPLQDAINAWADAVWRWRHAADKALDRAARKTPETFAAVVLLVYGGLLDSNKSWYPDRAGYGPAKRPKHPPQTHPKAAAFVRLVKAGNLAALAAAAAASKTASIALTQKLPDTVRLVAAAVGVELPPCPTFDDFDPDKLASKPTPEPSTNGATKPSTKKTTKRPAIT
jgi:ParB/RepB/Spo0J family partition protein